MTTALDVAPSGTCDGSAAALLVSALPPGQYVAEINEKGLRIFKVTPPPAGPAARLEKTPPSAAPAEAWDESQRRWAAIGR